MTPLAIRWPALLLLALACWPGCKGESSGEPAPAPPAASCPAVPQQDKDWKSVQASGFRAHLPASWTQTRSAEGVVFQPPAQRRRLTVTESTLPPGKPVPQALQEVASLVASELRDGQTQAQVGPLRQAGSEQQPTAYFLASSGPNTIFFGLAGRANAEGTTRVLTVTYEDDEPGNSAVCIERMGTAFMQRLQVEPGQAGDVKPLVELTPAALSELKRRRAEEEIVWLALPEAGGLDLQLELRSVVPADAVRFEIDGVPVAVDSKSALRLAGMTIDYPGQGFRLLAPR